MSMLWEERQQTLPGTQFQVFKIKAGCDCAADEHIRIMLVHEGSEPAPRWYQELKGFTLLKILPQASFKKLAIWLNHDQGEAAPFIVMP